MRARDPDEQEFRDWSLALGDGKLPTFGSSNDMIQIPDQCVINESESLITTIFGD